MSDLQKKLEALNARLPGRSLEQKKFRASVDRSYAHFVKQREKRRKKKFDNG